MSKEQLPLIFNKILRECGEIFKETDPSHIIPKTDQKVFEIKHWFEAGEVSRQLD